MPESNGPLGKSRDNIKMDFKEEGRGLYSYRIDNEPSGFKLDVKILD